MSTPPTVRFQDEDGNPTLGPVAGDGNQNYQPDNGGILIRVTNLLWYRPSRLIFENLSVKVLPTGITPNHWLKVSPETMKTRRVNL